MITKANNIVRFFGNLGLNVKISPDKDRVRIKYLADSPLAAGRFEPLMDYYFGSDNLIILNNYQAMAFLNTFNEKGYTDGICKRCGCQDDNACIDEAGNGCFWVTPDLCSECATDEEKSLAAHALKGEGHV